MEIFEPIKKPVEYSNFCVFIFIFSHKWWSHFVIQISEHYVCAKKFKTETLNWAHIMSKRFFLQVTCLFSNVLHFIWCVRCFICQTVVFWIDSTTFCAARQQQRRSDLHIAYCILYCLWVRIEVDNIDVNSFHMPISFKFGGTFSELNENKSNSSE